MAASFAIFGAAVSCDQNMSDTPLPDASAGEVAEIAARLSQAPSLSVPAGATISGQIELSERLAGLTAADDVVFVIARDPGSDGPPLAVERLTGNAYPMPFLLDASTAMASGAGVDRPVQIIVKVDKDGDAGTASAEDLLGFTQELVAPGDAGVRIELEATMGEIAAQVEAERAGTGAAAPGRAPASATRPPDDAAGGPRISGTVTIPPQLAARTGPTDVVFIIARDPSAAGPPVAVARLEGNRYPMDFTLDDSNRMLGRGPWPASLTIEARVDKDGDPLTRGEADLTGRASTAVTPGAAQVRIELGG